MCELFGMSSNYTTDVDLSLDHFAAHGGQCGRNRDGWGVAFFHDSDITLVREPYPASDSDSVAFIKTHHYSGRIVISHIRMATQGAAVLKNTQPFHRELGGRFHVFAHNGDLVDISTDFSLQRRFLPIGDTDSEFSFCLLMDRLAPLWDRCLELPEVRDRLEILDAFARDIRSYGPANFIYSDGDIVVAHGHRRRQRAGGPYEPPGLFVLQRTCSASPSLATKGLSLVSREPKQNVVLFASVPLTNEHWVPFEEGQMIATRHGHVLTCA